MTTLKKTKEDLIEYIDHVNASVLADFDSLNRETQILFSKDLSNHDLLWDIAAVKNTMMRLHSELKQLQTTVRKVKDAG